MIDNLKIVRFFVCIIVLISMNACTSSSVVNIGVKDSVSFTNLEISFPVSEKNKSKIRLRVSRASGDYNQSIPAGKVVLIENTQISGPTDISGTTDLTYASISIGGDINQNANGVISPREFGGSIYFGLSQMHIDLTLADQGTTYKNADRITELYLQLGLSYAISRSLIGRATLANTLSFESDDFTPLSEFDLKIDYAVSKNLIITGGFRLLDFKYRKDENTSVIDVEFKGPLISLKFPF